MPPKEVPKKAKSKTKEIETETVEYEVPDGGYGWVVVACAFIFISIPMGINASYAIYYEEWIKYFNADKAKTSLVGSVCAGSVPILGSVGGIILTTIFEDIRLVGIIGCLIATAGFAFSFLVDTISLLTLTFGAIGGLGMGLMFNCAYLAVGYYFDKNRSLATAIASSGTGFGALISIAVKYLITEYGWRGSLVMLAGICIQATVFGVLIRPLYARKVPKKPIMSKVEEIIPKTTSDEPAEPFRERTFSIPTRNAMASQTTIRHKPGHHPESALSDHRNSIKLNPYSREDVFFEGSSYDLAQIQSKTHHASKKDLHQSVKIGAYASQITIDFVPVNLSAWNKVKDNMKNTFDLKIFKSLTFCLVALGLTLHHCAFFVPYTYILSLAKDKDIPENFAQYLLICFGMSNFVNKLWITPVMAFFHVDQLYVVISTILIASIAAAATALCNAYYQFVIAAILYGGTSPIVTVYVTSILVKYHGIASLSNTFSLVTIIRGLGSLAGLPLAGLIIEQTGKVSSAFYFGAGVDIMAAIMFVLVLITNRGDSSNTHNKNCDNSEKPEDLIPMERDNLLLPPTVIVTVPTVEGNIDKMIHYSDECFDNLTVRDQHDHAILMHKKLMDSTVANANR